MYYWPLTCGRADHWAVVGTAFLNLIEGLSRVLLGWELVVIQVIIICLVTTCGWQSKVYLEGIVDQPLEGSKSTNHSNSDRQAIP